MNVRFYKVNTSEGVRYCAKIRKNIFYKWEEVEFTIETDTPYKSKYLTALQLGRTKLFVKGYLSASQEIREDVKIAEHEARIKEHNDSLYHITKWVDPNHSCCIEYISSAKEIGDLSDGYHTFNELYDFRREYNAALVNTGVWKAYKSQRHHDGELCFGGGWFIVVIDTPYGQISNHYENKYWDEFHCEEKEIADEWDGHTEKDVLDRLAKCNETLS